MNGPAVHRDFEISLHEGVLWVTCRPGAGIGPAELDVLANSISHFPGWQQLPLLIRLSRIRHITPPARQRLLAYRHLGQIALTGGDPVDRVLAAFITQSLSRTRYFTNDDDALSWLDVVARDARADVAV